MSNKNPGRPIFSNGMGFTAGSANDILSSHANISASISSSWDTLSELGELAAEADAAAHLADYGRIRNIIIRKGLLDEQS